MAVARSSGCTGHCLNSVCRFSPRAKRAPSSVEVILYPYLIPFLLFPYKSISLPRRRRDWQGTREVPTRARALCQQIGETSQLFPALWGLWYFCCVRLELQMAQARERATGNGQQSENRG